MLTKNRQLFATGLFLLDGHLIAASWLAAYWLRFYGLGMPAPLGVPPIQLYLWIGAVLTPVALMILRSLHLYRATRTVRLSQEIFSLVQGIVAVTAVAGLGSYLSRGELSRSVLLVFAAIASLALCGAHTAVRLVLRSMRRNRRNLSRVLIVGTGDLATDLERKMTSGRDFGFAVEGIVAAHVSEVGQAVGSSRVIGTVAELPELVERTGAELVYLALNRSEFEAEVEAMERLNDSTAAVRLVPDLARTFTLNASVEDFEGTPIILITESPGQGWNAVLKRAFDFTFSLIGLIALSPLLLLLALVVKMDSPGPALYAQERVGLSGKRFKMYKFRTMRADAEVGGTAVWTRPGDPRRTRLGSVLRRLSLDELPQLWNVLVGDMSLVGPRPERPVFVKQFRASIPRYMLRHHVKAGITGWAQVNGLRGDTPLDRRIEYDLYYIQNWSMGFDVKILLLTLLRVFRDQSAH
ncbi:MAG: undecaprenyl-phosphate glucose phosphotransferase [Candidatus Eisenbacteria bacterium]|uniref:Undecaprenyl-phosphate glucose phosphotransferase n=1 Tax=Eiseniibacteriota bacterium TaxID=2212470 RepID=A0A538T0V3_UNCEI|nr:MAG: undecaprenyl-phosphate glucose phosphotransferase [Candidatus Eisenbacteria bacterium]